MNILLYTDSDELHGEVESVARNSTSKLSRQYLSSSWAPGAPFTGASPDVLIIDGSEANGIIRFARDAKTVNPSIKVVLLHFYKNEEIAMGFIRMGVDAYLDVNNFSGELDHLIRSWIRQKSIQVESGAY